MNVVVIQNPSLHIVNMLLFLVCLTAVAFIAMLLLCGLRPEDIVEVEE